MMDRHDPRVFARNVRAFRALRNWSIRDLSERAGVSTKTIVKIEKGEGCSIRTEQKMALGFAAYVGRLWDASLLSDQPHRVMRSDQGRWFFAEIEDAERYHKRLAKTQDEDVDERLRSDPEEIQNEAERHRLGRAGLSRAFVRTMGGGTSAGYFQYNVGEIFAHDYTPPDPLAYTYLCICARGKLRFGISGLTYELGEGDSVVFQGDEAYWMEPLTPVVGQELPPMVHFMCLGVLKLPNQS